jgi:cytoskeletal protein CcmA (bactofilin family)
MAMFNKEPNKREIEQQVSGTTTHIAKGSVFEGNIESMGNIRVDGVITGNIKCKSKIVMGESALVEGNIISQNAEIAGEVKGLIEVTDLLVLKPTGIVNGDIVANKMVVESGGAFNGQCKMGAIVKEIQFGEQSKSREKTA